MQRKAVKGFRIGLLGSGTLRFSVFSEDFCPISKAYKVKNLVFTTCNLLAVPNSSAKLAIPPVLRFGTKTANFIKKTLAGGLVMTQIKVHVDEDI